MNFKIDKYNICIEKEGSSVIVSIDPKPSLRRIEIPSKLPGGGIPIEINNGISPFEHVISFEKLVDKIKEELEKVLDPKAGNP